LQSANLAICEWSEASGAAQLVFCSPAMLTSPFASEDIHGGKILKN
jgi:hypothetical protein